MDFTWRQCSRLHNDPTHKTPGFGDAIVCSNCDGFIKCDFCKRELRHIANFPISFMQVGDKFVCPEHVWAAQAIQRDDARPLP